MTLNQKFKGRHSSTNPDWITPFDIIARARRVFGGTIELDPASDKEANSYVSAQRYFTERGERRSWSRRDGSMTASVLLNPPGGQVAGFWTHFLSEHAKRHFAEGIWIGFSLEQLQTLQTQTQAASPLACSICVPKKRLAFVENAARRRARYRAIDLENRRRARRGEPRKKKGTAVNPSHGNYIVYVGSHPWRFDREFKSLGLVRIVVR